MNERIKKLADQATTIEYGADRGFDRVTFDKEKFAELIVQECAQVAWQHTPDTEELEYSHLIKDKILKRFGVEEQEKVAPKSKCSVCGTTENVRYMGGYQPYLCDSIDCIPF